MKVLYETNFNNVHLCTNKFCSERTWDNEGRQDYVKGAVNIDITHNIRLMMRSCITAFAPDTGKFSVLRICFSCVLMSVLALATTTCTLYGSRDPAVAISDPATLLSTPGKPSTLADGPLWQVWNAWRSYRDSCEALIKWKWSSLSEDPNDVTVRF